MKPFWRTFPDLDSKEMLLFYKEFGRKNRPLKMYKNAIQEIHACQLQIGCQSNHIETLNKQLRNSDEFAWKVFKIWMLIWAGGIAFIIFIIKLFINYAY